MLVPSFSMNLCLSFPSHAYLATHLHCPAEQVLLSGSLHGTAQYQHLPGCSCCAHAGPAHWEQLMARRADWTQSIRASAPASCGFHAGAGRQHQEHSVCKGPQREKGCMRASLPSLCQLKASWQDSSLMLHSICHLSPLSPCPALATWRANRNTVRSGEDFLLCSNLPYLNAHWTCQYVHFLRKQRQGEQKRRYVCKISPSQGQGYAKQEPLPQHGTWITSTQQ